MSSRIRYDTASPNYWPTTAADRTLKAAMRDAWDQSLTTGVAAIDQQHEALFDCMARVESTAWRGGARDEVIEELLFLKSYVDKHFATEEDYMLRFDYPKLTAHRVEHDTFRAHVMDLLTRFRVGEIQPPSVAEEMNHSLVVWFKRHIEVVDRELATFLSDKLSD